MSHYMTALAMKQKGLKPATKIVLYWLADHHNGETGRCFPSLARLSEVCEMSKRSVQDQINALEAAGLISISHNFREDGQQTANNFSFHMQDAEGWQNLPRGVAKSAQGGWQDLPANNLGRDNPGSEPLYMGVASVFDDYNAIAQQTGWPTVQSKSKAREAAAKNRMKECGGYENWLAAMNRAARSDFLLGRATGTTPASFDWLNKPANFAKLMEGNYDNRDHNTASNPTHARADRPGAGMAQAFASVAERLSRNPQEGGSGGGGFI